RLVDERRLLRRIEKNALHCGGAPTRRDASTRIADGKDADHSPVLVQVDVHRDEPRVVPIGRARAVHAPPLCSPLGRALGKDRARAQTEARGRKDFVCYMERKALKAKVTHAPSGTSFLKHSEQFAVAGGHLTAVSRA